MNAGLAKANVEIRHGCTLETLDQLTRMALSRNVVGRAYMDAADRYHLAWSGIALYLYEATDPPDRADLIHAGWAAISQARDQELQAHGWRVEDGELHQRPAFVVYWDAPGQGFEETVIERLGLRQALTELTPACRDAVNAVYALGSYQAAQEALGITRAALTDRLMRARMTILRAWMPGETPIPPRYVHDRKPINCGTPHGARAHRKRRETPCEACRAAAPPDPRNAGRAA